VDNLDTQAAHAVRNGMLSPFTLSPFHDQNADGWGRQVTVGGNSPIAYCAVTG
jgi:hypothetical protein